MFKFLLNKDLRANDYSAVILKCNLCKKIRKIGLFFFDPLVCALAAAPGVARFGQRIGLFQALRRVGSVITTSQERDRDLQRLDPLAGAPSLLKRRVLGELEELIA
jgi:hypothetical protein